MSLPFKITLQYTGEEMMLKDGDIVKLKSEKRNVLKFVCGYREALAETYTMKLAYRPAPKSRLKNKSLFSKFKKEILYL